MLSIQLFFFFPQFLQSLFNLFLCLYLFRWFPQLFARSKYPFFVLVPKQLSGWRFEKNVSISIFFYRNNWISIKIHQHCLTHMLAHGFNSNLYEKKKHSDKYIIYIAALNSINNSIFVTTTNWKMPKKMW